MGLEVKLFLRFFLCRRVNISKHAAQSFNSFRAFHMFIRHFGRIHSLGKPELVKQDENRF